MINTVQIVLLLVIILLAVLLIVLGIQVFLILKELRFAIKKFYSVLDHTDEIAKNFSQPINMLGGLFSSSATLSSILQVLKMFNKKDKEK